MTCFFKGLMLILISCMSTLVSAENNLEREIKNTPLPHTKFNGGKSISVKMVYLSGYLNGIPSNAETLENIKSSLRRCVQDHREQQLPYKEESEWPDHLMGQREVNYFAKNYTISYFISWTHVPNILDCSLTGQSRVHAVLKSPAGLCNIDLRAKTYQGQCDWNRHKNAVFNPPQNLHSQAKSNIPASAMASINSMLPQTSGVKKTIFGVECQVETLLGEDLCMVPDSESQPVFTRIMLERGGARGLIMKANQIDFALNVSERIFAPHLEPGYTEIREGNKR